MQKESIKFGASTLLEGMTSIRALLSARQDGINDRKIYRVLYDKTRKKDGRELKFLEKMAQEHKYELQAVEPDKINALALGTTHGGVLAECSDRTMPRLADSLSRIEKNGFYADLYNSQFSLEGSDLIS